MLCDVTYTFWSENQVQECAVRLVAMAVAPRRVIRPLSWQQPVDRRGLRWKGMWEQQSSICIWARNQAASWPRRCAPRSEFDQSGPHPHAGLLISHSHPIRTRLTSVRKFTLSGWIILCARSPWSLLRSDCFSGSFFSQSLNAFVSNFFLSTVVVGEDQRDYTGLTAQNFKYNNSLALMQIWPASIAGNAKAHQRWDFPVSYLHTF